MKKYNDFTDFMQALENIVNKFVNHYKSDFYDYDIAKLEANNASHEATDKKLTFIVRDCGTWLIYTDDINKPGTGANTIFNYYKPGGVGSSRRNPEKFYNLDLSALTIVSIKFDENGRIIHPKKARRVA